VVRYLDYGWGFGLDLVLGNIGLVFLSRDGDRRAGLAYHFFNMIFAYLSVLSLGWSIAHNNNTLQNLLFFFSTLQYVCSLLLRGIGTEVDPR